MASILILPIAVAFQAAAPAAVEAPVLARTIERGEQIAADDFAVEERSAAQARGALPIEAAAGMEANRRLSAGNVVRSGDVIAPRLVRRGEPVTIYVRSGGLTITASGRALGSAGAGEAVRVVASTNRTLDGVVEGSGAVRVSAP
ncbi:flagellar basal body P-ring formation chaperone FlgA [Sphingosinicella terrae]|uniref:flagellar basal body P-ring formation chaperone FlgA n=1 Tax=Sphingosinicella terrae TaxID=2172047 RepID=UPI000E0D7969|nr:flagellar basal body P-ring formation chaperone FlgA [Sphingosinicella terrae]